MSLRINTNVDSLTAYRNLSGTQTSMSSSIERLSSGLRINKAADDAAGLAISQGLTAQINGIGQAVRNAQDGINVVQTADGALTEVQSILQRSRQLVVQGANDSNDSYARTNITTELSQLKSELTRIQTTTEFNGKKLLDGSADLFFQVGANSKTADAGNQIEVSISDDLSGATLLGNAASLSGSDTAGTWSDALDDLDTSLRSVSTLRANLGALQNRFQHTINNLSVTQTNLQASNSAILDTDMAQEMSNYSRTQILAQAGTSMLKQANSASQSVLSLLG